MILLLPLARKVGLGAALALAGACSEETAPPRAGDAGAERAWAFEKEFPGGPHPASLVIRLDKTELTLADEIIMEQELRVEDGFVAEFPEYLPEDFEGLTVMALEREPPAGGDAVERKRLILEPERSGELSIAPLAVYFRRQGEDKESTFLTEEIPVSIEQMEDVGALAVRPLRGIFETTAGESPSHVWAWALAGAAIVVAAAVVLLKRRRVERPPPPPPPAEEIAYDALRRLVALDLVEKGEIEAFFIHLSAILRTYIENRFHVHAPERTTEEFLEEAAGHEALGPYRVRLAQFLELCDRVKFARFHPDEKDIQGAFDVLKQFIAETSGAVLAS